MRLIDADKILEVIDKYRKTAENQLPYPMPPLTPYDIEVSLQCCEDMKRFIDAAPTIATVKHGKWVSREPVEIATLVWCSVCDSNVLNGKFEYCPYCGAKMDLEVQND